MPTDLAAPRVMSPNVRIWRVSVTSKFGWINVSVAPAQSALAPGAARSSMAKSVARIMIVVVCGL